MFCETCIAWSASCYDFRTIISTIRIPFSRPSSSTITRHTIHNIILILVLVCVWCKKCISISSIHTTRKTRIRESCGLSHTTKRKYRERISTYIGSYPSIHDICSISTWNSNSHKCITSPIGTDFW